MNFLWIYNPEADFKIYFKTMKDLGLTVLMANPFMYDNSKFLSLAKQAGMKLNLNFPIFDDGAYLSDHPDKYAITAKGRKAAVDWQNYSCPTDKEHIEVKINDLKKLLKKLNPEYVSLDFIRFFTFWEKVKPDSNLLDIEDGCYCPNCIDLIEKRFDLKFKDRNPGYIKENYINELGEFRVSYVTNLVKRITSVIHEFNPDIKVMMKVVPWLDSDFEGARIKLIGQDYNCLKDYIDIFMPMTYLHTIRFPAKKIVNIVRETKRLTGKEILPLIQFKEIYNEAPLSNEVFIETLKSVCNEKIKGIGIFRYDNLKVNKERYNLLKEVITSQ